MLDLLEFNALAGMLCLFFERLDGLRRVENSSRRIDLIFLSGIFRLPSSLPDPSMTLLGLFHVSVVFSLSYFAFGSKAVAGILWNCRFVKVVKYGHSGTPNTV